MTGATRRYLYIVNRLKRMTMKKFLMLFCTFCFLIACRTTKNVQQSQPTLYQKWNLVYLNGDSIQVSGQKPVYIEFHDSSGKVTGTGGCNRFFSEFSVHASILKIKPVASTRMACLDEAKSKLETQFFQALQEVTGFAFDKGDLILTIGDRTVAAFSSSDAIPDVLAGHWRLFYIHPGKIPIEKLYPGKKPALTFTEGQSGFSGNTSCNSITAKFIKNTHGPIFKPGVMTMMACPGTGEQLFMNAFKAIDDFNISQDTLTLLRKHSPLLKFVRSSFTELQ